ncbi:MAG: AsmA family protein [Porticoccaceae bacterium]
MPGFLKFSAIAVLIVLLILGGVVAYLMFAIDINSYKPQIEQAAKEQGIELDIQGQLGWSFFPTIAISVGETHFHSAQYGIEPSSIANANLALGWRQLLRKQLAVNALTIDGADIHIISLDSGAAVAAVPATGSKPAASQDGAFSLAVDQFGLHNSKIRYDNTLITNIDASTEGVDLEGSLFTLRVGFDYDQGSAKAPLHLGLSGNAGFNQRQGELTLADMSIEVKGVAQTPIVLMLAGKLNTNLLEGTFDLLTIAVGDAQLSGSAAFSNTPKSLSLELSGTEVNLDTLLPPANETDNKTDTATTEAAQILSPLFAPLALLDGGTGKIKLSLESLIYDGITLTAPQLLVSASGNRILLDTFSTGIFGGTITANATFTDSKTPKISFTKQLRDIDIAAAMDKLASDVDIAGTLNMGIDGATFGNSVDALITNTQAAGILEIKDPILATLNIEKSYCEVAALVEKTPAREQPWPAGTRLNNLVSDYHIADGNLILDNYSTGMGNLKLSGNGTIDLINRAFDIRAVTLLDGDRTSDSGCEIKSTRVRNKEIPLICKDSFANAGAGSCKPDPAFVKQLLQDKLLDKLIDDKDGEESEKSKAVKGLLKGIFGN